MTSGDFWSLTPRRFAAIVKAHAEHLEARETAADRRAALLATLIANKDRPKGRPPVKMDAFMPQRGKAAASRRRGEPQTPVEMDAMLRLWSIVTAPQEA